MSQGITASQYPSDVMISVAQLRNHVFVSGMVAILVALGMACSSPRSDPFDFDELRKARQSESVVVVDTPTPNPDEYSAGTLLENIPSKGTISLVNLQEKGISLYNNLAGYIIAHGYLFDVELVDLTTQEYQSALSSGEVDAILSLSRSELADWYGEQTGLGTIVDVGSVFESDSELRIVVAAGLTQKAPEVVEFLSKIEPGDEKLSRLEAIISLIGRVAVRPNVGALRYLTEEEDTWTRWVPEDVADNVKIAIADRKTSLKRRCYRSPESGVPVCG